MRKIFSKLKDKISPPNQENAASQDLPAPVESESTQVAKDESLILDEQIQSLPEGIGKYLFEETQKYTYSNHYASGLRFLLGYLDEYPDNEYVLKMASLLIQSGWSYGNAYKGAKFDEELTDDLVSDRRLDSLFNQCSKCGTTWISTHHLMLPMARKVALMNPVGAKCSACSRVFCRKCLGKEQLGVELSLYHCPECGGHLTHIDKPTGRGPRQANRINLPIEFVLLLREGPIPPDADYLTEVLKRLCPDVLESADKPKINAVPVEDWKNIANKALASLMNHNKDYLSDDYLLDRVEGVYKEDRVYIIRVYRSTLKNVTPATTFDSEETKRLIEDPALSRELIEAAEHSENGLELFDIACRLLIAGNFTAGIRYMQKSSQFAAAELSSATIPTAVISSMEQMKHAEGPLQQAMTLAEERKHAEALELLRQAKEITPRWAAVYSTLGWVLTLSGMFSEARSSLEQAIEIDPYLPEAHNNLGMLHVFERRRNEAEACFNYAIKLRPSYIEAKQNLEQLDSLLSSMPGAASGTAENGIYFWFDWSEISDSGHSAYGQYVYKNLLPHFSPKQQPESYGYYVFLDGDFINQSPVRIPYNGSQEETCLKEVIRRGVERSYVVAIYGSGSIDFSAIAQALSGDGVTGYLGMTSGYGRENFQDFVSKISLVHAFTISGNKFDRQSFDFLSETDIKSLGFEINDLK